MVVSELIIPRIRKLRNQLKRYASTANEKHFIIMYTKLWYGCCTSTAHSEEMYKLKNDISNLQLIKYRKNARTYGVLLAEANVLTMKFLN